MHQACIPSERREVVKSRSRIVGQKEAKLALLLIRVDPLIGGVLLAGEKGTGKSTLARSLEALLPADVPFVEVPLNVTEDSLLDSVSMDESIRTGTRAMEPGLLSRAAGGILFVDDVNLLNPDLLKLILDHQDRAAARGESGKERRGSAAGNFSLVATMDPDEGPLPPQAPDRFGLCSFLAACPGRDEKTRILRNSLPAEDRNPAAGRAPFRALSATLLRAAGNVPNVRVADEIRAGIVQLCLDAHTAGHRGDIVLQRAAVAYAALRGDSEVTERHLKRVLPLVLAHRARDAQELPDEPGRNSKPEQPNAADNEKEDPERPENDRDTRDTAEDTGAEQGHGEADSVAPLPREGGTKEETFTVGDPFGIRRLILRKDRIERKVCGRRTGTRFSGKGGRYVKSIPQERKNDIAVDATLRAAAPWQVLRGRTENVLISREDLRYRQRERKMGHLVVFVLDCSGSMGAKKRMVETKAAVLSLLIDCYHKRDKVSLIAFRKDRAEVVLPPTSSVELASRRLSALPVGGRTPLTAGLYAACNLIRRVHLKEPRTRSLVVVISDGRANQSMSEMPVGQEIMQCARELRRLPGTDTIVVDTEDKSSFMRSDSALALSGMIEAQYFTTNELKAQDLARIVKNGKEQAG